MNLRLLLLTACLTLCNATFSQLINNKLDLDISCRQLHTTGNNTVSEGQFEAQALYPGFSSSYGFRVSANYHVRKIFSFGLTYHADFFHNWQSSNTDNYSGSTATASAVGLPLGIHTQSQERGFLNRLHLNAFVTPSFGMVRFNAGNADIWVENSTDIISWDKFYGLDLSFKVDYKITNTVGLFFGCGWSVNIISGLYYPDDRLKYTWVEGGLSIYLLKNKRLYL
jgi:hypothetical protein